jgi:hypothetical protein
MQRSRTSSATISKVTYSTPTPEVAAATAACARTVDLPVAGRAAMRTRWPVWAPLSPVIWLNRLSPMGMPLDSDRFCQRSKTSSIVMTERVEADSVAASSCSHANRTISSVASVSVGEGIALTADWMRAAAVPRVRSR